MNCTDPPLTTVRQPIEPMGRMVIELLVGQIAGGAVGHEEYFFEPELVVRGSSGPASVALHGPLSGARARPLTGSYALGVEPWTSRFNLEQAVDAGEAIELAGGARLRTVVRARLDPL